MCSCKGRLFPYFALSMINYMETKSYGGGSVGDGVSVHTCDSKQLVKTTLLTHPVCKR